MINKKIGVATKALSTISLGLISTALTMPTAIAETFSIGGTALNTNNQFPLKDGHPIISTWPLSPTDNDQQFDQLSGNQLKHRSTGKCLNAYKPAAGSIVNVYPCNASDGDQKFSLVSVGSNTNLIQKMGTNLCLDMPSRSANLRIMLQNCNSGSANQRFVSGAGNTPPPTSIRQSQANVNIFVSKFNETPDIQMIGTSEYPGQCVSLVVRYVQDSYGTPVFGPGNGGQAAAGIASKFPQFFLPVSDPSDPIPGSIISFPNKADSGNCNGNICGHVALVVSSQRVGSNLNIKIMDSNGDGKAGSGTRATLRDITVNTSNSSATGYGNSIYWINPKN